MTYVYEDWMKYDHGQAKKAETFATHKMLLRGQSLDKITAGQLVAEYDWARGVNNYEYAAQIVRLMEFKNQQEVRAEELAQASAVEPKGKPVNRERVGDAARARYSDHLATLYGQGYIDQDEFERLNGKALTAKTVSDLADLLTDLPPLPVPARPDVVVQRRRFMERRVSEVPFFVWGAMAIVLVLVCLSWLW